MHTSPTQKGGYTITTTSQTELEAINSMLATIGEAPLSTLTDGLHADAIIARDTLRQVSREVQQTGWFFNREYNYPLTPDTDGFIMLPENIASVDVEPRTPTLHVFDIVSRGRQLYNMTDHTYVFADTISATVVFILPFEELPEVAKSYITVRASRLFLSRVVGSDTLMGFTQHDETTTWAALRQEQVRKSDRNFLSPHRKSRRGLDTPGRAVRRRM